VDLVDVAVLGLSQSERWSEKIDGDEINRGRERPILFKLIGCLITSRNVFFVVIHSIVYVVGRQLNRKLLLPGEKIPVPLHDSRNI
jgi:hypothetical protein